MHVYILVAVFYISWFLPLVDQWSWYYHALLTANAFRHVAHLLWICNAFIIHTLQVSHLCGALIFWDEANKTRSPWLCCTGCIATTVHMIKCGLKLQFNNRKKKRDRCSVGRTKDNSSSKMPFYIWVKHFCRRETSRCFGESDDHAHGMIAVQKIKKKGK